MANTQLVPLDLAAAITAAPGAGVVRSGVRTLAAREFLSSRGSLWPEEVMQGHIGRMQRIEWRGQNNTTVISQGAAAPTVATAQTRAVAATSKATRTIRSGAVSTAVAGTIASFLPASSTAIATISDGSGNGGFLAIFRFVVSDAATVSGARMFVGMWSSTGSATNVESSSLTNCIGVAAISTSSNLFICFGGSTAQTAIDLGASFPANTLSADVYELVIHAPPTSTNVSWQVTRLNTGDIASGTITNTTPGTTLPASTTFLAPRLYRTNNATALTVGLDLASMVLEVPV